MKRFVLGYVAGVATFAAMLWVAVELVASGVIDGLP